MGLWPGIARHEPSLKLIAVDVGQGDSLLLVSPSGYSVLVAAGGSFTDPAQRSETRGPDPGEEAVSGYLWSRGFKQIDVRALTHAHQDHIGGLTAICENFKVKTLWLGRGVESLRSSRSATHRTSAASWNRNVAH
jgi:competence protein ComEC